MSVKAKFKVQSITETSNCDVTKPNLKTVRLSPVYDSNPESENGKYWQATPSGSIELGTINEDAAKQFEVGKDYYITFEKA